MPSRRQEKFSRVVKEAVSDILNNHLNDPRVQGFISVTEVEMTPDLRNAHVYLSILTETESGKSKTIHGIQHAAGHIQHLLGERLTAKFCPHLTFQEDDRVKGTIETLKLIDQAKEELDKQNPQEGERSR